MKDLIKDYLALSSIGGREIGKNWIDIIIEEGMCVMLDRKYIDLEHCIEWNWWKKESVGGFYY